MATATATMARARRQVVAYFYAMHAIGAEDAVPYKPERPVDARLFERMRAGGIVHEASPGRFWLDIPAYEADRSARRRRLVPIVILLALIAAAIPLFFYQG